ncbi:hypothetical protein NONO_c61520 [Nocardia nova SH22a]|uniref:Uncharacterized protein n=1 Tax=Nocardia nova SH22a TaxID=1415166 RepID=W5TUT1_9NOCA|nr:hypothetical protein [Nocardia nova]AHH20926.1 hypothetical protein NONO_c61520 [Nocardia nova SH22a]
MIEIDTFRRVACSCEGYLIDTLSMSQIDDANVLELALRWGPDKPDVVLAFQGIYYFELGKTPEPGAYPLEQVAVTVLPSSNDPWPAGLGIDLVRSSTLPDLVWFHAEGPVQLNVVAAIVTAYVEAR